MTAIVSVYAVFGSDEEARRIGRAMVEERLAACVNILGPCHSIYRWQGRIEEGDEVAALFKTADARAGALIARIAELHDYDVPAAVAWPVGEVHGPYAEWVASETAAPSED
ncbi:divalent-cation tolerance protein CutA [Allosphingosinicella sp.]|uniref:divalent-cation tolerance protein CutA n=1 Tax=Allosphingosinicella sp. TaxID=2823234 RepID=UPI002EF48C5C